MAKTTGTAQSAEANSDNIDNRGVGSHHMKATGPVRTGTRGKKDTAPYQRRQSARRRTISAEGIPDNKMDAGKTTKTGSTHDQGPAPQGQVPGHPRRAQSTAFC